MQLSSFKTYVKYDFKRTDKDTEMVQAYNDMINWVSLRMPHSGYKYQSYINTSVGVEDYGLPSTAIHVIHPLKLIIGTGSSDTGYPMDHISKQEYDHIEPNPNRSSPAKGRPSKYTIFDRCILVTPIPDVATYLIELAWARRKTTLSADADLPELGSEWDEVYKWGVLERLYAGMGQLEEAAFWGAKYHAVTTEGDDVPVGMCRQLFEIEKNREGSQIGQVAFNDL